MKTTIALALTATLLGSAVTAAPGFGLQRSIDDSTVVTLDLVRADVDGTVEITDFSGKVLANEAVLAGANSNVRFQLDRQPVGDVLAVLYDANGDVVAERRLDRNQRD